MTKASRISSEFDHIVGPQGRYRRVEDVLHLLHTEHEASFDEPQLIVHNVPWQYGSRGYRETGVVGSAEIWRTPSLGGKLTICVLCHGEYFGLHQRCLESIRKTVPREFMDLRVAMVQVGSKTKRYVRRLEPDHMYLIEKPQLKYPVMRKMLWDPKKPVTTPYVAWFDDTAAVANGNWMWHLGSTIEKQTLPIGMYGLKLYTVLESTSSYDPAHWFKAAPWYRGKLLRNHAGAEAANGRVVHYCAGWFWCSPMEVIRTCDIPCPRLGQKGGEITVGEQLHQHGYLLKQFNGGQSFVKRLPQNEVPRPRSIGRFPWY